MLLALTGFVMIGLLMYFLLKGKAIPVTLFVVLPIIGALINGFGIADITDYIKSGVSTTWGMAALFVFVITYFGIMTDVGMFDKLVKKLIKIANGRVLGILLVVVLVSILGHLDGNSPTTYLIVIPAMAPLCKKLNIPHQHHHDGLHGHHHRHEPRALGRRAQSSVHHTGNGFQRAVAYVSASADLRPRLLCWSGRYHGSCRSQARCR